MASRMVQSVMTTGMNWRQGSSADSWDSPPTVRLHIPTLSVTEK